MSWIGKSLKAESGLVAAREWLLGYGVSYWGDKNTLELDCGDGGTRLWSYQTHLSVHCNICQKKWILLKIQIALE